MTTQKKGAAATGPDNNKRLAMLEAGVSSLSVALAANGLVKEGEAYNVFDVTTAAIKGAAEINDRLMALIGAVTGVIARFAPDMELAPKDDAETLIDLQIRLLEQLATAETPCDRKIAELEAALAAGPATGDGVEQGEATAKLEAKIVELNAEIHELNTDLEEAVSAKNAALNDLAAAKAGAPTPEAGGPPAVEPIVEADPPPVRDVARELGETLGKSTAAEILGFIQEDTAFELVLTDGNSELLAFPTVRLTGAELRRQGDRYAVIPAIHAKLESGSDAGPQEIHGAALLVHGEQVDYCPLERPQIVNPGEERAFRSVFIFG